MSSILITGIAGGLARRTAALLQSGGHVITGVDYREAEPLSGVAIHRASYDKTAIEDVFRHRTFDAVLHLGRVGNLTEEMEKRFDLNVLGSQKLMNLCLSYGVRSLIVLSTFHIYGAHARNPTPISEGDPLRAGYDFPQIADAIQLDNMASTWVYQHAEVRTVVLRPTNVVGPHIQNAMSRLLRRSRIPYLAGYNPMIQFVDEDDLARAIVAASSGEARGVYNVAGGAAVPWRTALDLVGAKTFPLPSSLVKGYLRAFSSFPEYLVNFVKYPCVISDAVFRHAFDWKPEKSVTETLASTAGRVAG